MKKDQKKYEDSLKELQDNIKHNNIRYIGILEGGRKEKGIETVFEKIITENFSNLERGKSTQVQEAQMVHFKMNPKRPTPTLSLIHI